MSSPVSCARGPRPDSSRGVARSSSPWKASRSARRCARRSSALSALRRARRSPSRRAVRSIASASSSAARASSSGSYSSSRARASASDACARRCSAASSDPVVASSSTRVASMYALRRSSIDTSARWRATSLPAPSTFCRSSPRRPRFCAAHRPDGWPLARPRGVPVRHACGARRLSSAADVSSPRRRTVSRSSRSPSARSRKPSRRARASATERRSALRGTGGGLSLWAISGERGALIACRSPPRWTPRSPVCAAQPSRPQARRAAQQDSRQETPRTRGAAPGRGGNESRARGGAR